MVGGHEERRHGIVLAKSAQAKAAGIVTGEALWSAREKCPGLVAVSYTHLIRSLSVAEHLE